MVVALGGSVGAMTSRLSGTLDELEGILARLQGPPPNADHPSAARALDFAPLPAAHAAGALDGERALLDTPEILSHLRRLFRLFAHTVAHAAATSAEPTLSSYAFSRLVRAAQLSGEGSSAVEVDLVFCKVAKSRTARMGFTEFLHALSILAMQLHPTEPTPASAFHALMNDRLLTWMVHYQHELAAATLSQPPVSTLFARHAGAIAAIFAHYLALVAPPIIPAVAAHPQAPTPPPHVRIPVHVAHLGRSRRCCCSGHSALASPPTYRSSPPSPRRPSSRDGGASAVRLCPPRDRAALLFSVVASPLTHTGTCVEPSTWHAPESHGATLAQFTILLGRCAIECFAADPEKSAEKSAERRADKSADTEGSRVPPAHAKARALFRHLFRSEGARRLGLVPPPSD